MKQHSTLVTRLQAAMATQQINARELAEQAGVGASFVYDILHGKSRSPTVDKLSAVAQVLGTSVQHLLTGDELSGQEGLVAIAPLAAEITPAGVKVITAKAPPGAWRFHHHWITHELGASPDALRILEVLDDSMEPTVREGDALLVDTSAPHDMPHGIYVILDTLGLLVRRLTATAGGMLLVEADNAHFPPQTMEAQAVNIVGRVIWSARKFV